MPDEMAVPTITEESAIPTTIGPIPTTGGDGGFSGTKSRRFEAEYRDMIDVNRDRLEIMLRDFETARERAKLDDVWPWVATAIGFLVALITGDFHQVARISREGWEVAFSVATILSVLKAVHLGNEVYKSHHSKRQSCADVIDELLKEMRAREEASSLTPQTEVSQPTETE